MEPFIGREEELSTLENLLTRRSASLVVIRGRRRIGKSRLVEEFAKDKTFYTFTGLPPEEKVTAEMQRAEFAQQLSKQFNLPPLKADDWGTLFELLARHTRTGRVIILFDEISWMGDEDPTFLGKLKNAWDLYFKKNPKLILVLCGSVSSWIEENILSSTGFFGRIAVKITLEELSILESSELLKAQKFVGSPQEIFKILSVTGGVPWYLEQIEKAPAHENIRRLCFQKDGLLVTEFKQIFHDLFEKRSPVYQAIVSLLADGPKTLNEIVSALKREKSGVMSGYLNDLIQAGFLSRDYTWLIESSALSRLSHYRLSDNYLRFYLKYLKPRMTQIESNKFKKFDLTTLPGLDGILSLQFENLVLKNREIIYKKLHLKPEHILTDNPFFQRATSTQAGCQIDYLIQTKFNTLFACEIKCTRNPIGMNVVNEMKEKLKGLVVPRRFSYFPVLIHVNGVSDEVLDSGYFTEIIAFSDFLSDSE